MSSTRSSCGCFSYSDHYSYGSESCKDYPNCVYGLREAELRIQEAKDESKREKSYEKEKQFRELIKQQVSCKKHKKYAAKQQPKVSCNSCWVQYFVTKGEIETRDWGLANYIKKSEEAAVSALNHKG